MLLSSKLLHGGCGVPAVRPKPERRCDYRSAGNSQDSQQDCYALVRTFSTGGEITGQVGVRC